MYRKIGIKYTLRTRDFHKKFTRSFFKITIFQAV